MKYTIVDLFSGCGGFSEGFHRANFDLAGAVDFHEASCLTLKNRLQLYGVKRQAADKMVIHGDLTSRSTWNSFHSLNLKNVSVLLAGVPCQTFSSVGKAQDRHSMKKDQRNWLYVHFLKYLKSIMPRVVVFENVQGILSSRPQGFRVFDDLRKRIKGIGYDIIDDERQILLNAVDFAIPQNRKRVFLIGVRRNLKIDPQLIYDDLQRKIKKLSKFKPTVKDAIRDLPRLLPGQGSEEMSFRSKAENKYVSGLRKKSARTLYNHVCRNHNRDDQKRFKFLSKNGWELRDLQKTRPDLVHHNPMHFKNRYTVQQWDKPGKTVVSHLYKDGNLFIHPDPKQQRTFTVREAARIQSFPDDFIFFGSRTNQFIQVGNAVPPKLSYEIARSINSVVFKKQ